MEISCVCVCGVDAVGGQRETQPVTAPYGWRSGDGETKWRSVVFVFVVLVRWEDKGFVAGAVRHW